MSVQPSLFGILGYTIATMGTGILVSGSLASWACGSIQPLAMNAAIAPLAIVIGFVASFILQKIYNLSNQSLGRSSFYNSYIAYTGVSVAGMVTGFIPASMLGIGIIMATTTIGFSLLRPYASWARLYC